MAHLNLNLISAHPSKNLVQIEYWNIVSVDLVGKEKWKVIGNLPDSTDQNFHHKFFRINTFLACGQAEIGGFIDVTSELKPMKINDILSFPVYAREHPDYFAEKLKEILTGATDTLIIR